jgi:hypothetical protein
MSFFFLMPSILLSGFAFPFRGMPGWAQAIGEALPVTHFLRIVRGLMLKGANFEQIAGEVAVLLLMLVIVSALAISRYRVTLDCSFQASYQSRDMKNGPAVKRNLAQQACPGRSSDVVGLPLKFVSS